jgi:hypothetical protein
LIVLTFWSFTFTFKKKTMEVKVTKEEIFSNPNDYELGRLVRRKYWEQTCEICGDPTYRISSEHLVGYNHMECVLKRDNEYDACVLCGRQTSYKRSTPIDLRIGYIEGAGQACDGTCRKV